MARLNRKWGWGMLQRKHTNATLSEEPSLISLPLTCARLPPSLALPVWVERELRSPQFSVLLLQSTAASNAVLSLMEPQFPQLCRSRLSGKGPPSANAT